MPHQPRRTLADWTPDQGDVDAWLTSWADAGWVPEHGEGVECVVNGVTVSRWAMIEKPEPGE